MEWTGLNELREKYLSFFESKDHLRLPSFSLVPENDKSLLLINSGMAPMKKYFTGELIPDKNRITTCQKCIRTPDIERVGKTSRHGTFFEMLGNFSFGDYFKNEAIAWAWEFCTEICAMPVENLYISIYEKDDEAFDIWTKKVGVDPTKIVRLGKDDNFWEHGAGPCGPCSEIYYDRGKSVGCGSIDCTVGCDCDRFVEFWNLVFTQFESDGNGNYTPLSSPNIDTGMGLERLACISQDVANLFEVDTVQNIMKHIMDIANVKYQESDNTDISLRVITDHIRSTTMMIGDGVLPSNEGRGYVLRRLLRRAARHGRLLSIDHPFLSEVAETVIKENAIAYPNLVEKHDFIIKIIGIEEENFSRTIDSGLKLLSEMIEKSNNKILSGSDAFKLSDTFGFPIDLTKEIIAEKGLSLDENIFNELVQQQKETARNSRIDAGADAWKNSSYAVKDFDPTEFVGYSELKSNSNILHIIADGEFVQFLEPGIDATLILDKTPFYAEGGGQIGDIGIIKGKNFEFNVYSTTKSYNNVYLHHGKMLTGASIKAGDNVVADVDKASREAIMRNHTAAHLIQAALRKVLGNHVEQSGQLVTQDHVRFDFTHFAPLTTQEILRIEHEVNSVILSAINVTCKEMSIDEAKSLGAIALFGEKYGEVVRVVQAGDFTLELCGGTHVDNSGKLGLFKILSDTSVAAGVRRIEGVTGFGLISYINKNNELISKTASAMKLGNLSDLEQRAAYLMQENKLKEKEIAQLKSEIVTSKVSNIFDKARVVKGINVVTANLGEASADEIRSAADTARNSSDLVIAVIAGIQSIKSTCTFAAACSEKAVKAGAHAGKIIKETAKIADGAGGGRPESAMAGGKNISKVDEALKSVVSIVESMLN